MALTLRESTGSALGAEPDVSAHVFTRAHLWLVRPPEGVLQPVWDVVCLAALSAMDLGRHRVVWRTDACCCLPSCFGLVLEIVADFWGRLQTYVTVA